MFDRLRRRPRTAVSPLPERRPDLAAADRTEEAAALLFVGHTSLALGRVR